MPVTAPRICHAGNASVHELTGETINRCVELGFSHVAITHDARADESLRVLSEACDAANVGLILDIDITDLPVDHPLVKEHPECFAITADARGSYVDPRLPNLLEGRAIARPRLHPEPFIAWWERRLSKLVMMGSKGFCVGEPHLLGGPIWRELIGRTRGSQDATPLFIADTSQAPHEAILNLGVCRIQLQPVGAAMVEWPRRMVG